MTRHAQRALLTYAALVLLLGGILLFIACLATGVWDGKLVLAWLCALGFIGCISHTE